MSPPTTTTTTTSAVKGNAPLIRLVLYLLLGLWSFFLFIFCVVRLAYTLTPRAKGDLMNGLPFYDGSVVELLVSSILGFGFSIFMCTTIRSRKTSGYSSRNWFEVSFLFLLWMLWLGGASAASAVWPDLSWCIMFSPCRVLQALMGWAWLGWLCLTFLFLPTLWIVAAARNWDDNFFDTWNYNRTAHVDARGGNRGIPDTGTNIDLPSLPVQRPSEGAHEKSLQSRVEREVQAREQVWNFEKEAAKMRARLNSWIGDRRRSRDARASTQVDLEHGKPYIYNRQVQIVKKKEPKGLPPSPPPPPNGALGLNIKGEAEIAP